MAQRVSLAQEQLKLAQTKPELHNMYETYRRMYAALGVDNVEQMLPPPPEPTPTAPSLENGKVMQALSGQQQLKAFPEQNHEAHIATHLAFMGSIVARSNPAIIQVLQTHIFEHISLQAQAMAQQEMQQQQPEQPQEQPPMEAMMGQTQQPQIDPAMLANKIAEIEAKLVSEYVEKEKQIMQADQKDPLVDLKAQEIQIKQQEAQQEAQNDQQRLELDQQRLQEQTAIQQQRINSTEDIAQMRAKIAMQRQQQTNNQKVGQ